MKLVCWRKVCKNNVEIKKFKNSRKLREKNFLKIVKKKKQIKRVKNYRVTEYEQKRSY